MDSQTAYSSASVDDLDAAKDFYTKVLELEITSEEMGLRLGLPGGGTLFLYPKSNHQPATYTFLHFVVSDVDSTVAELKDRGAAFERYEGIDQDDEGIARSFEDGNGPDIAWFKDPAGNILAVLQEK